MRDSRIGTFGAAAIFFVLALKIFAIAAMGETPRGRAVAGARARAMGDGGAGWRIDYLRAEGAGTALLRRGGDRNFVLASAIAVIGALPISRGACCWLMPPRWRSRSRSRGVSAMARRSDGRSDRRGGRTGEVAVLIVMAVI